MRFLHHDEAAHIDLFAEALSIFVVYSILLQGVSSVGSASAWYADGRGFYPRVRQHSFVEFGHEIISTVILSLPLIQEGQ